MSSKDTGGPAFPYSGVHHTEEMNFIIDSHGMTLRDHFAGLAMQGIVNSQEYQDGTWETAEIARQSYEISDAMIKARGQQPL